MKRILITIVLLVIARLCFGQDYISYFNIANDAEYQLSLLNFTEAENSFKKLESEYGSLKPKDNFYLGIIEYLKLDSIQGFKYLAKSAEKVGFPTDHIGNYKKMFPQLKISDFSISNLKQIEKESIKQCKKSVFDTLAYFLEMDQLNRSNPNAISREEDVIVQMAFFKYLEENGIPDVIQYGDATIALITLHLYNEKMFSMYKEFLFSELTKGNIYPNHYSSMVDRHQYDYYKPTIFNSFTHENITDLKRLAEINNNREKIALSKHFKGNNIRPIPDFYSEKFILKNN